MTLPFIMDDWRVLSRLVTAKINQIAACLRGEFLITYDNAEGVKALGHKYGFDTQAIAMKNTHHAEMTERLIGRNLNWVRQNKFAT